MKKTKIYKMGLKKGQCNNRQGRPKGKPNKATKELKTWIQEVIDGNRTKFETDLKCLEAKDRLIILEKLMQYVVPKMQSVSIEEQIRAEYANLEQLLNSAPEHAINEILERIKKNEARWKNRRK